jgi:type I restriction enzyme S subunit
MAVTLGDVATFIRGITFKPEDVVQVGTENSIACLRTKNVQAELDLSDVWAVDSSLVRRTNQYLQEGDILISSANSWNLVGKCSWIPVLPWKTSFGGFVSVLRANPEKIFPRFLFWWFSSARIQAMARSFGNKTTSISNLNVDRCLALPLELPSLDEQKRISNIMDESQLLKGCRITSEEQLDDLFQSVFLNLFEMEGSGTWPVLTMAEIASKEAGSIRTGPFGSQLLVSEFVEQGVAVLGIDNAVSNEFSWGGRRYITQEKYTELKRYTVRPGDFLVTIMGTCGRCAVVPDDIPLAINTKHLCCISLDGNKCLPVYLHAFFLRHPMAKQYLMQKSKGAIMSGLNMGLIKDMPVILPPLEIQQQLSEKLKLIKSLKKSHRSYLEQLDSLFASLQHRAFRGEL